MKRPIFLISELVNGRLKSHGELAAMASHWNELFVKHRHMTRQTEGEQKDAHVMFADVAADRARRIEAVMRQREGWRDGYLPGLLLTAKRHREELNQWREVA